MEYKKREKGVVVVNNAEEVTQPKKEKKGADYYDSSCDPQGEKKYNVVSFLFKDKSFVSAQS